MLDIDFGIETTRFITDVNQCHLMTDLARDKGCLVEDSLLWYSGLPTSLFYAINVVAEYGTGGQFTALLKQLLDVGYDKEYRNDRGETPLLYAIRKRRPRSLAAVQLLIAEDADVDAVENHGRGALHFCYRLSKSRCNPIMVWLPPRLCWQ